MSNDFEPKPHSMERLNAYTQPHPNGKGVVVDVGGMALDLISVLKASGESKANFLQNLTRMWDDTDVQIIQDKKSMI